MDTPEYVWFLMARNLSGEAGTEEQEELMKLLHQNPQWMQHYDMMKTLWKPVAGKNENADDQDRIRHILQLADAENNETPVVPISRARKPRRLLWAGAAAVVAVTLTWTVMNHLSVGKHITHASQQEIVAQKGSKTRTLLPDGSTVWLNAGSKLIYPANFNGPLREVTLEGEAYFDVVKLTGKPFIVHAADINIKVLGTAFNVKSYDEDKTVETTLIRGLVQITRENDGDRQPILLQPNQKVVLNKASQSTDVGEVVPVYAITDKISAAQIQHLDSTQKEDEIAETGWVYNRIEFQSDNFERIALKLERWYNIIIHFEDEAVKKLTFTGSIESETVEQAFLALKAAAQFRYEIRENEIYIRSL
jgi:transmembrane sensor